MVNCYVKYEGCYVGQFMISKPDCWPKSNDDGNNNEIENE